MKKQDKAKKTTKKQDKSPTRLRYNRFVGRFEDDFTIIKEGDKDVTDEKTNGIAR